MSKPEVTRDKARKLLEIDKASWDAGYASGMANGLNRPPPYGPDFDAYAFASGYIEGKAARDRTTTTTLT